MSFFSVYIKKKNQPSECNKPYINIERKNTGKNMYDKAYRKKIR